MKKVLRFVPVVARVLLGLLFTVTGLNGFLNFLPQDCHRRRAGLTARLATAPVNP